MATEVGLFGYAWRYRRRYALGTSALLATDALELVTPLVVAIFIDSLNPEWEPAAGLQGWLFGLTGRDYTVLALILVSVALVQTVGRYLWRVGFVFTSQLIARDLRRVFFRKLTFLPQRFYDERQTGELMSRASNDVEAVRMFLGVGVLIFADTMFYFLFVPVLLFTWSPRLTLYLLLGLPAITVFTRWINLTIHSRFERVQEELANISAHAQEAASGVEVIRGFAREDAEIARFSVRSRRYQGSMLDLWRIEMWMMPVLVGFIALGELVVILVGGREVVAGTLTPGQFVAFFLYLVMLTWPMEGLGWVLSLYQRGRASFGRLQEILRETEDIADGEHTDAVVTAGRLDIEGVTFTYPGSSQPALADLDIHLEPGQTVAVVGRLGSGKSTLAQLVCRALDPQVGRLVADGVDLRDYRVQNFRKGIGYVPQQTFLFSASLADNIALGLTGEDEERVRHVTELAALSGDLAELPDGLDTLLGERGVNLSGGQRQRVALARALALDPRLLVLDDCLSAVDTQTEMRILRALREFRRDRSTLIVSHRLTAISDADWIIVLEHGRMAEQGAHEDLIALGGWYAKTYERQLLERALEEEP